MSWYLIDDRAHAFFVGSQAVFADGVRGIPSPGEPYRLPAAHDPHWRSQAAEDLGMIWDALILGGTWTSQRDALAVLHAALAPCVGDTTEVMIGGGRGSGHLWTAAMIAGFWQPQADLFAAVRPASAVCANPPAGHPLCLIEDDENTRQAVWVAQETGAVPVVITNDPNHHSPAMVGGITAMRSAAAVVAERGPRLMVAVLRYLARLMDTAAALPRDARALTEQFAEYLGVRLELPDASA